VTTERGRHKKDEVSGYLHCEGDPDDHPQSSLQHQGPVRSQSGENQGGCRKNAGKMFTSDVLKSSNLQASS